MPQHTRRVVLGFWGFAAILAATITGGKALGYRLNFTASAPIGLWREIEDAPILSRGMLVSVCPPDAQIVGVMRDNGFLRAGDCPTGTVPLLKPVVALPGDLVEVAPEGAVSVNGRRLTNTAPVAGIVAYPPGQYAVAEGTVWLFSSYDKRSFDSRYYGPVPAANIRSRVIPVLVDGNPNELTNVVVERGI